MSLDKAWVEPWAGGAEFFLTFCARTIRDFLRINGDFRGGGWRFLGLEEAQWALALI